jgi:Holliday junction DNA helicase RuvA
VIAQLRGTVLAVGATWAIVETGGLGFRLSCPPSTTAGLQPGRSTVLHTSLVVREDAWTLFGFTEAAERDLFELALSASGVGPRLALAITSVLSPGRFASAVRTEDLSTLVTVPGVGRKGAQRIIIELKDKIAALTATEQLASTQAPQPEPDRWREQVSAGLEGLGWSARDAEAACDRVAHLVDEDPGVPIGVLMKAALQSLARA